MHALNERSFKKLKRENNESRLGKYKKYTYILRACKQSEKRFICGTGVI